MHMTSLLMTYEISLWWQITKVVERNLAEDYQSGILWQPPLPSKRWESLRGLEASPFEKCSSTKDPKNILLQWQDLPNGASVFAGSQGNGSKFSLLWAQVRNSLQQNTRYLWERLKGLQEHQSTVKWETGFLFKSMPHFASRIPKSPQRAHVLNLTHHPPRSLIIIVYFSDH